ncbi:hypothetical protein RSAG8_13222, partial [Rhizoctonia solani AG-8 WAC10335]
MRCLTLSVDGNTTASRTPDCIMRRLCGGPGAPMAVLPFSRAPLVWNDSLRYWRRPLDFVPIDR